MDGHHLLVEISHPGQFKFFVMSLRENMFLEAYEKG
jgi:hypothetical protein